MFSQGDPVRRVSEPELLTGYSSWSPGAIADHVTGGGGGDIGAVPGDFVIGNRSPHDGWAMSSCVSAFPWFWASADNGALVQGGSVFDVARRANLRWEWNRNAIQCIGLFDHTIGVDTLHRNVQRMPAGSWLRRHRGEARVHNLRYWHDMTWERGADAAPALECLREAFVDCQVSDGALLSLSAGYDSRLLLALCMSQGIRPRLAVMGSTEATDVTVAHRLAGMVNLPIERVTVDPDDYLKHGSDIAQATSGEKTAAHWHTWLYGLGIEQRQSIHLVGSNGEFARSYYFDHPNQREVVGRMTGAAIADFFAVRLTRKYQRFSEHNDLVRQGEIGALRMLSRTATESAQVPDNGFLPALDRFYADARVRHFIGSGLACYAHYSRPRSPFLDGRWIRAIAGVERTLKEGSRYHRYCIDRLAPELLSLPFNAPLDAEAFISHSPFAAVAGSSRAREMIVESQPLDDLISRKRRIRILEGSVADTLEDFSLLLALHFAAVAVRAS